MAKDVWFFHHTNKENSGGDDGVSKCNMFEVSNFSAFIHFFLNLIRWKWSKHSSCSFYGKSDSPTTRRGSISYARLSQGIYSKPDSIVVLCTYLGQLTKIRDALASCKLSVVLDARDEENLLANDESSLEAEIADIDVSKQVSDL